MLSCEIFKIFKNTYFEERLRTTASKIRAGSPESMRRFAELSIRSYQNTPAQEGTFCFPKLLKLS